MISELAIDMTPILVVTGDILVGTFRFVLGLAMFTWALYWARIIYRWLRK